MTDYRVINADVMDGLAELEDESIDMIFTDPPYGHNNNDGDLISRREAVLGLPSEKAEARPILNDGPEATDIFKAFLSEARRVLVKGGCCCCCCCGGGGPDPQFARWALMVDDVFEFKQMVVWDKGPMGIGWHYRRSYEVVLVGQKRGAKCKWYDETNRIENIIRHIPKQLPSKEDHPTVKPVALAAHFIGLHSRPGELVLDPFCGGGSTGIAAKWLGRSFLGFELDPQWADMAIRRLERPWEAPGTDVQQSLFGGLDE